MNALDIWFTAVAGTSWRLGLLLALCLVLRRWLRNRVPASALFGIWIVLAAALFVPTGIPTVWSPFNLTGRLATLAVRPLAGSSDNPASGNAVPPSDAFTPPLDSIATDAAAAPLTEIGLSGPGSAVAAVKEVPLARWLAIGWLSGAGILFLWRIAATFIFARELSRTKRPASARVREAARRCAGMLGVGQDFEVAQTPLVPMPSLHGIRRPTLLISENVAGRLSDEELDLVLLHELGHWQRRDLLAQTLIDAAKAMHWFNPFVWLAGRAARTDCEHACDEFVMRHLNAERHGEYGLTLLKVVGMVDRPRHFQSVLGIFESKKQLKERIVMITAYTFPNGKRLLTGAALVAAVAVFSLTRESQAQAATASAATSGSTPSVSSNPSPATSQAPRTIANPLQTDARGIADVPEFTPSEDKRAQAEAAAIRRERDAAYASRAQRSVESAREELKRAEELYHAGMVTKQSYDNTLNRFLEVQEASRKPGETVTPGDLNTYKRAVENAESAGQRLEKLHASGLISTDEFNRFTAKAQDELAMKREAYERALLKETAAGNAASGTPAILTIQFAASGEIKLNDKLTTIKELPARLKLWSADAPAARAVQIAVDAKTKFSDFVPVMEALQTAGIRFSIHTLD